MRPRKKLAGLFSTGAFFVLCSYVLLMEGSIDLSSVFRAFYIGGIGAIVSGIIGFLMGKIFEMPPAKHHSNYSDNSESDLLINDVMIDDLKTLNKD